MLRMVLGTFRIVSVPPPDSIETKAEAAATSPHPRQMRLLQVTNPITTRVGAEVFAGLPNCPGVYFFYDVTGKLLYIGQSLNLRARVTSYRHVSPERHPRRILRLVHRIARIEWQTCETAEAAIELERVLLLQHRPPFNRAGTWQAPPWYLYIAVLGDHLQLTLARAEVPPADASPGDSPAARPQPRTRSVHLPLPFLDALPVAAASPHFMGEAQTPCTSSGFPLPRAVHAALCRCLMRLHHPELSLSEYPAGLLNFAAPLHLRLPFPGNAAAVSCQLTQFLSGHPQGLLDALKPLSIEVLGPTASEDAGSQSQQATPDPDSIASYWSAQVEMLQQFAMKKLPALVATD